MPPDASFNRRQFLRASSSFAMGLALSRLPARAARPAAEDSETLVPADKNLQPDWVRSLSERGAPEVFRGTDLRYVGMPIGGIGAGQLYLGGDGKLWHWDVLNRYTFTGDSHYAEPLEPSSPFKQGFSLIVDGQTRPLDKTGFADISFRGEYPIGKVTYADSACVLTVELEAFSPFIPLETEDSSLPVTVLRYTVRNPTDKAVSLELRGSSENPVCLRRRDRPGVLRSRLVAGAGHHAQHFTAERAPDAPPQRPDVVVEDWSAPGFGRWRVTGEAFGAAPISNAELPDHFGHVVAGAARFAHSFGAAPGTTNARKDAATGELLGPEFVIERRYLVIHVAGNRADAGSKVGVRLHVATSLHATLGGEQRTGFVRHVVDVSNFQGQTARLEVFDHATSTWGWIALGGVVQTDLPSGSRPLEELSDYGDFALALVGPPPDQASAEHAAPFEAKPEAFLGRTHTLKPGDTTEFVFLVAWHFPNLSIKDSFDDVGRHYATRFRSALHVADYVATNLDRLTHGTRLWRDTWYDSTLPYWFLDRTFLNASILATSTIYRFRNGRFYGWEGVGNCQGTCGHVYHYAHSVARLFPDLERDTRERVDFGLAQNADGGIRFRGEFNRMMAIDAQSGYVLRALREHQMSADDRFLRRIWPGARKAVLWLITQDANGDGLIEGAQHNTLDSDWHGPVAWLSGLYVAALEAGAELARLAGDEAFAMRCATIADEGRRTITARLFNGEYYVNRPDPAFPNSINSGTGCLIDQVMGQSWAFQVRLPRVFPAEETRSALRSLWRYNFITDAGRYRETHKPGRWYAMNGEAGLLVCTFPRKDWSFEQAAGQGNHIFVGYFNECMNGFEYQVAGHMLWEGMTTEGLAITRAVHDRYHASKRNPWNEIECGDHYARSMASHGVYLAACGYEYDGPAGRLAFAPRLTPERFRCAFTAAQGWGTFSLERSGPTVRCEVRLRRGALSLKKLVIAVPGAEALGKVVATGVSQIAPVSFAHEDEKLVATWSSGLRLGEGEVLVVQFS